MSEQVRGWIYRVAVAAVPLLTAYGVINEAQGALWVGALASIFGFGLASYNTSIHPPQ
jgi:hypothetical protein